MDVLQIIEKYYTPGTQLYDLLIKHSSSVAERAIQIAESGRAGDVDKNLIYEAAMLHDIGIYQTDAAVYMPRMDRSRNFAERRIAATRGNMRKAYRRGNLHRRYKSTKPAVAATRHDTVHSRRRDSGAIRQVLLKEQTRQDFYHRRSPQIIVALRRRTVVPVRRLGKKIYRITQEAIPPENSEIIPDNPKFV